MADDLDLATRTVLAEAGENASPVSWAAVAHVIKNRLDSEEYGDSLPAVLLPKSVAGGRDRLPFEPWSYAGKGKGSNDPLRFDPSSEAYKNARTIVEHVLDSNTNSPDPTNGATHFIAKEAQAQLGRDIPSWAQGQPLATIGGHSFYAPDDNGGAPIKAPKMDVTGSNTSTLPGQTQSSPWTAMAQAIMAQMQKQQQGNGTSGSAGSGGYSPNIVGQLLFGPQGARGFLQNQLPSGVAQHGLIGAMFGQGGGQGQPVDPSTQAGAPQAPAGAPMQLQGAVPAQQQSPAPVAQLPAVPPASAAPSSSPMNLFGQPGTPNIPSLMQGTGVRGMPTGSPYGTLGNAGPVNPSGPLGTFGQGNGGSTASLLSMFGLGA